MFIRPRKPAPEPLDRRSLAELGYRFDPEDGLVRAIATGDDFASTLAGTSKKQAAELYQTLSHPASREVYRVLAGGELGMVPIAVPDASQPHCCIYATPGALDSDRLVVLVVGHGTCGGVWAWNVLLKSGLRAGSVVDYVRDCVRRGLGVLVLNPNENIVAPDGRPETTNSYTGPAPTAIAGSETADEHVGYVWTRMLRDRPAPRRLAFVAYNAAGISLVEVLRHDFERFAAQTACIAFIDSLHSTHGLDPGPVAWLEVAAKHWETSVEPADALVPNPYVGCPTLSADNTTDCREMTPSLCRARVLDYVAECLDRGPVADVAALLLSAAASDGGSESDDPGNDAAVNEALESVHLMETPNIVAASDSDNEGYVGWD
ncbi:hypothetical protein H4R18_005827 [Coemansia javaensis]|uniref:Arb2 domain-containing protein n=1 Tax=Coemansia javaensis TaxID=2761396 RepID=A0A9W8LCQ2_9FUNG|nr:hypothetical protein H4R18_005827 [Coemansia javaensis]